MNTYGRIASCSNAISPARKIALEETLELTETNVDSLEIAFQKLELEDREDVYVVKADDTIDVSHLMEDCYDLRLTEIDISGSQLMPFWTVEGYYCYEKEVVKLEKETGILYFYPELHRGKYIKIQKIWNIDIETDIDDCYELLPYSLSRHGH